MGGEDPRRIGRRAHPAREVAIAAYFFLFRQFYVAIFVQVTRPGLPSEYFTDQTLTNDLCKSVRYIFFKDRIDKEEKLNHKWIERKDVEKSGP